MLKRLIIPILLLFTSLAAHPVLAQSTLYRDFGSSPHEPYTESKRLYREGVKYALAGLYAQAAQIFQQAVKLDPQFADAHFALGHAYADMGRWQNAADSFQRALELNPKDLEAQDRLEQARDMLARQSGKKPEKKETPKTQPPPQPVAEQISLNAKPVDPASTIPVSTTPASQADTSTNETTEVTETNNANAAAKELPKLYRVGPGDVLDIRINDAASPQSTLFTVTPAGLLEHPLLAEPLHVGGLSVEEISTAIEADLKRRALNESPKV
jgi:tetratricopeptide (TPR) repeat protein